MYGVKQMIHKYANIPYDDVVGKFTLDSQYSWLLWHYRDKNKGTSTNGQEQMDKTQKTTLISSVFADTEKK